MKNCIKVSIIIPCLNEENNIIRCLGSILKSTYPKEYLEILVIDGNSNDNTVALVRKFKEKSNLDIKILYNKDKQQNLSLNIGINNSSGEVILRLDAHGSLNTDYIKESINFLYKENPNADAVGAPIYTKPRKETLIGRGIAIVMSSRFGVGDSSFRTLKYYGGNKFMETDTIPYGCYKKEVFNEVGLYNEQLFCSEDLDFHSRMKKSGKVIFINKSLHNIYHSRSKLLDFIKHAFRNGKWSIIPISITGNNIFSIRHMIPLIFSISIIIAPFLSTISSIIFSLFIFEITLYSSLSTGFSFVNCIKHKDIRLLFILPIIYFSLHLFYGLGSLSVINRLFQIKK